MDFCPSCGELLVVDTRVEDPKEAKDKLYYRCMRCDKRTEANKTDFKLFEEDFVRPRNIDNLIKYACNDIVVPRKQMHCPKCKKESIVAVIRMPNSLRGIFICCKCKNYWEGK